MTPLNQYPNWAGHTAVCIASGESLTQEDVDYCRGKAKVGTVNSSWQAAPWADIHYSSDHDWWHHNLPEMRQKCQGQFWTGHTATFIADDLKVCKYDKTKRGLSLNPPIVTWGGNSGHCLLNLIYHFRPQQILLLGFDMKGKKHWHEDHPKEIQKDFNFPMWIQRFNETALSFRKTPVQVINCTRDTALTCFPRVRLEQQL